MHNRRFSLGYGHVSQDQLKRNLQGGPMLSPQGGIGAENLHAGEISLRIFYLNHGQRRNDQRCIAQNDIRDATEW
jgi:hypothetical protein